MSLEDFQQNLFYLRSGFVFAALAVCYRYKQLCSSAPIPSCISAAIPRSAVQSHIDSMVALSHAVVSHFKQSNTFPMSLEDFQQNLFYLRSGFVSATLAVCYRYAQLYFFVSILPCISAAISHSAVQSHIDSMVALSHAVVSHFKQSNTFPMSLEDFQQNLFYLRSGFVFATLAVCYRYAQLYFFVRFGIYSTSYLGSIDATVLLLKAAVFLHLGV